MKEEEEEEDWRCAWPKCLDHNQLAESDEFDDKMEKRVIVKRDMEVGVGTRTV